MTDSFTLVDPKGWEYDLHSVYSAYVGYFQTYNVPWYDRSWGHLFETFDEFLAFSWPVITVTDSTTGKGHIVTRLNSIGAFLKMIKTRFGETLPQAPNILQVFPFETSSRHLRHVSDYSSYKKMHSTLPAAALSAFKVRVRAGNPQAIREVWEKKDKTFMAIDFEWNERNEKSVLEWGYAAVRCGHLDALGHWPPIPNTNYRKGHYIVSEYVDKVVNKYSPNYPWQYAFGESQVASKTKLPQIIQAVISSLASPDSETIPNTLVLVAHNIQGDLARLEEMKIKLPHNMLVIDTMVYERYLYTNGMRGVMQDPKGEKIRAAGSNLSLENLIHSLSMPTPSGSPSHKPDTRQPTPFSPHPLLSKCTLHNAGNDAFLCLYALQCLLDPQNTQTPIVVHKRPKVGSNVMFASNAAYTTPMLSTSHSMPQMIPTINGNSSMAMGYNGYASAITPTVSMLGMSVVPQRPSSAYDLAEEFGQMNVGQRSNGGQQYLSSPARVNARRYNSASSLSRREG
ncbi:hypothetical protein D9613_004388 [Agrocybe pediades]|uniref:Gfd2/YDR514C-like C-terminal domain-containing protein n=1 Tax=Agrocybe pediades TaxID=84607 RepID=A0A8H4VL81_9AGAR|nr:hypothetical protein D9613_004388 [Agrocybe pediades]